MALELCRELGLLVKSVDETNEEGEPPLVAAGAGGSVWALELLLAAGCEVSGASDAGWTALHAGCLHPTPYTLTSTPSTLQSAPHTGNPKP